MALKEITPEEMVEKGVVSAPDILTGTPRENKLIFDRMVAELLAPAHNAAVRMVNEMETQREGWDAAEADRKQSEIGRETAEQGRVQAEQSRVTAEGARDSSEQARALAEQNRAAAEQERDSAEKAREAAELKRVESERSRVTAEQERVAAEQQRVQAEQQRISAEEARQQAETSRLSAEQARVEAEKARADRDTGIVAQATAQAIAAENSAVSAKASMDSAANSANTAEADRIAAGESKIAAQKSAEAAAKSEYAAAESIKHGPIIRNGTWWLWDSAQGQYIDSGNPITGEGFSIKKIYPSVQAMNADFSNPEVQFGSFVLVNTEDVENPDNARLYIKGPLGFQFIVDMSGATGIKGTDGKDGVTFTPSISPEGVLSWTNNGGLPNPPPVSVGGKKPGIANNTTPGLVQPVTKTDEMNEPVGSDEMGRLWTAGNIVSEALKFTITPNRWSGSGPFTFAISYPGLIVDGFAYIVTPTPETYAAASENMVVANDITVNGTMTVTAKTKPKANVALYVLKMKAVSK